MSLFAFKINMDNKWIEIAVMTSQVAADVVSNRLIELGSQGTLYEDQSDDPDACTIKAYYPQSLKESEVVENVQRYLSELERLGIDIGKGEVISQGIESIDWSSNWKQYFKPFRVGERFVLKPSWETFDRYPSDLVIEIDPGMAFGTGLHASTRLALTLLERYVKKGTRVLDVGTGSGILSIAAARLGAIYVLGVDADAEAVAIARENVRINALEIDRADSIQQRIELLVGSIDTLPITGQFECIVMNIRPNIVLPLLPYVKVFLQTGGTIIISGILEEESTEFLHDIRAFDLIVQNYLVEDGWIAYVNSQILCPSKTDY
jgi:ribosomal protein L11 methyltransferase